TITHDREINVCNTSNNLADETPQFEFRTSNAIKEEPREIKEEPVEVKEEPFDDFTDMNQEGPIVDVFFPFTETSRSVGHTNRTSYEDTNGARRIHLEILFLLNLPLIRSSYLTQSAQCHSEIHRLRILPRLLNRRRK
ncbi:hypothetical protein PENTCL1PPCAC_5545, partial [Pristionchus entomophagus]